MKFPKVKQQKPGAAEPRRQFAALPWRVTSDVEVMLASSRETRRWVIPKGWPMKGRKPHATAALEALEEAGLLGKIDKAPIGFYHYYKRLKNGASIMCKVEVFPLRVLRQRKNWPEKGQRMTQWFPYTIAADQVVEEDLGDLILAFGEALKKLQAAKVSR